MNSRNNLKIIWSDIYLIIISGSLSVNSLGLLFYTYVLYTTFMRLISTCKYVRY